MSYHDHLLEQARELLTREPKRPRQASLRRAVSSAYYAVFHLLIHESTRYLLGGAGERNRLRGTVARGYDHGEMSTASKCFQSGFASLPAKLQGRLGGKSIPFDPPLRAVARVFVELQEMRHRADYDLLTPFTRREATLVVERAEKAFADWDAVRNTDGAALYLIALLLWEKLKR